MKSKRKVTFIAKRKRKVTVIESLKADIAECRRQIAEYRAEDPGNPRVHAWEDALATYEAELEFETTGSVKPKRAKLNDALYPLLCCSAEVTTRYGKWVAHLTWLEPMSMQLVEQWVNSFAYEREWRKANEGAPPNAPGQMDVSVFLSKTFFVAVGRTKFDRSGKPLEEGEGYSVVRGIERRLSQEERSKFWSLVAEWKLFCSCTECAAKYARMRDVDLTPAPTPPVLENAPPATKWLN